MVKRVSHLCCALNSTRTARVALPLRSGEPLALTSRCELDALRLATEDTVAVCDMCADDDSSALLVADYANRCVKAVAASGGAALVFQCGADSRPRALQLVRPAAGGGATLLLVEWLDGDLQAARYALVAAARSGQRFRETRRLPLPVLSKDEPLAAVNMYKLRGGFVLIGNQRAKALEAIDARDANDIRRLAEPVALDFELWQFSVGTADAKELLAATDARLAQCAFCRWRRPAARRHCGLSSASLPATRTTRPTRVLLFGSHVLVAVWDASRDSHWVECHSVSGATPPQPPRVLTVERQVRINCWRAAGERVQLFDWNHKQLQSLECALLSGLSEQYLRIAVHFTSQE